MGASLAAGNRDIALEVGVVTGGDLFGSAALNPDFPNDRAIS
jgi:hypothetical protein